MYEAVRAKNKRVNLTIYYFSNCIYLTLFLQSQSEAQPNIHSNPIFWSDCSTAKNLLTQILLSHIKIIIINKYPFLIQIFPNKNVYNLNKGVSKVLASINVYLSIISLLCLSVSLLIFSFKVHILQDI